MKAVEVTGTTDEKEQFLLDQAINVEIPGRVQVILLFDRSTDELENDPDDTPIKSVKASLKILLQQAKAGEHILLAQMWEGIGF